MTVIISLMINYINVVLYCEQCIPVCDILHQCGGRCMHYMLHKSQCSDIYYIHSISVVIYYIRVVMYYICVVIIHHAVWCYILHQCSTTLHQCGDQCTTLMWYVIHISVIICTTLISEVLYYIMQCGIYCIIKCGDVLHN